MPCVLVACEFSGVVRNAFRRYGCDAFSCDIVPSVYGTDDPWHIQTDVLNVLTTHYHWDIMIAFPPCTHLAASGAAWFAEKVATGLQREAVEFVRKLWDACVPRIAIENPVGVLSRQFRPPDRYFQPHQFGEPYRKRTCLWLKNLPVLYSTKFVAPRLKVTACRCQSEDFDQNRGFRHKYGRGRDRSVTYAGVAEAMAAQWSRLADGGSQGSLFDDL